MAALKLLNRYLIFQLDKYENKREEDRRERRGQCRHLNKDSGYQITTVVCRSTIEIIKTLSNIKLFSSSVYEYALSHCMIQNNWKGSMPISQNRWFASGYLRISFENERQWTCLNSPFPGLYLRTVLSLAC